MTITLDLSKEQGQVFEDLLTTNIHALTAQENALQAALLTEMDEIAVERISSYLTEEVIPQKMLSAEILQTIREASASRIIIPNSVDKARITGKL
jgi:hypothetical protein